jgi:hypothetical protein
MILFCIFVFFFEPLFAFHRTVSYYQLKAITYIIIFFIKYKNIINQNKTETDRSFIHMYIIYIYIYIYILQGGAACQNPTHLLPSEKGKLSKAQPFLMVGG